MFSICTQDKKKIFGEIEDGEMILSELSVIAHDEFEKTGTIRKNVEIDCFIVMPNHVHAIVVIAEVVGAYDNTPLREDKGCKVRFKSPAGSLGSIVRGYKSSVTKRINQLRDTPCTSV